MRNTLFLLSIISFSFSLSMEPQKERGLLASMVHRVNQELYPLAFYTDDKAFLAAEAVMKFDPKHPKHELYKGDAKNIADIVSALTRHRKGLKSLWEAAKAQDSNSMETLKKALENVKSYCSLNHESTVLGFWETRTIATKNYLDKLNLHVAPGAVDVQAVLTTEPKATEDITFPPEKDFPSYEQVKSMVLESYTGTFEKFWHWVVKNYIEQIPYLLDKKSQITGQAILHLHPSHPHHTENWKLNLNDKFHLWLIYQGVDREYKLSKIVEDAAIANDLATLTKLDPNDPQNPQVMSVLASFYPPLLKALITGIIHKTKTDKERDEAARKAKEQEQKDLIEKNRAISTLINSLGRKFSDASTKDKLESQRGKFLQVKNNIFGRSLDPQQVLETHAKLTELSNSVDLLLASSTPVPPSPSLNNSATSLPSFGTATPAQKAPAPVAASTLASIQTVVDTAHLASATAPAAVQQTALPAPSFPPAPLFFAPEPPAVPKMAKQESASNVTAANSQSPAASTSDASATSPKAESPQASPPRTPGGSLLVTPANPLAKSSDEEFPDPRAPFKPAAKPAALEAQAHAKNGKKNKKGT